MLMMGLFALHFFLLLSRLVESSRHGGLAAPVFLGSLNALVWARRAVPSPAGADYTAVLLGFRCAYGRWTCDDVRCFCAVSSSIQRFSGPYLQLPVAFRLVSSVRLLTARSPASPVTPRNSPASTHNLTTTVPPSTVHPSTYPNITTAPPLQPAMATTPTQPPLPQRPPLPIPAAPPIQRALD